MVTERSSNAFDTIRIRGKWWIPDGTENPRKVPGELTFEVSTGGTLDLDEALSDKTREFPVIHGLGTNGECVTAFNGGTVRLPTQINSVGVFQSETVSFSDMWVGNHWFNNKEEVRLRTYSFGIHNIENWADRRCFPMPKSFAPQPKSLSVVYKPPKPLLLFEDDRLTIRLDAVRTGPSYSLGQLESSIKHYPRIVIHSKTGLLPYYGKNGSISDREQMIFILVSLLMGIATWQFGFEGIVEPIHKTEKGYTAEISTRHYYRQDLGKANPSRHPIHLELLFPYETIGNRFPVFASRFSEVFYANEHSVKSVFRMLCQQGMSRPLILPELLFAFEDLEKNLFSEKNIVLETKENTIANAVTRKLKFPREKSERDWLSAKLSMRGLSFSTRCKTAFVEMKSVYPDLVTDLQKPLIKYLKRTRNRFAHADNVTSNDQELYVYASHWMAEFMTLMILRACGLSANKIKQVFFRDPGPDHGKTKRFFDYLRNEIAAGRLK